MGIQDIEKSFISEFDSIDIWYKEVYNEYFADHFKDIRTLYDRLKSTNRPITNEELEKILTQVPLELFAVAESVNSFKVKIEVLKLETKKKEHEAYKASEEKTQTFKKEEASYKIIDDQILIKAYESMINRVESEMSFSRELIMSAKKIWSARCLTDNINPVGEISTNSKQYNSDINSMPDYRNQSYIQ